MELFHQTVSMKSVGNLTQFVREHMLEPFDAAKATRDIVAHFDDLTKAHEAVQRAQAQLDALTPLLKDCDAYDKVAAEIGELTAQREALRYYFANHKLRLVEGSLSDLDTERTRLTADRKRLSEQLDDLRDREASLRDEIAGHGGNRLAEIERKITEAERTRADRMARHQRFAELLGKAGLDPVQTAGQFASRRQQIAAVREATETALADSQNELTDARVTMQQLEAEAAGVNAELLSLRERKSNIPKRQLDVRTLVCRGLGLDDNALPFAGELIAVRPEETDWEGAAERLLHSFALSVLVPDEHYRAVSDWIDGHPLRERIVYYRVPAQALAGRLAPLDYGPNTLAAKLDVKDTPFAPWLERELANRADAECVETMAEFRRVTRAVTRAGQVKGGVRHEKDDRFRIDDRSRYVLGWSNERKIDALIRQATELATRLAKADAERARHDAAVKAAIARGQVLAGLDQTTEFAEIDYQSVVNQIAGLRDEHATLKGESTTLTRLDEQLTATKAEIADVDGRRTEVDGKLGGVAQSIRDAEATQREVRAILAEVGCEPARAHFGAIADLLAKAGRMQPASATACDRAQAGAVDVIVALADRKGKRRTQLSNQIVTAMDRFRGQYPVETSELDSAVEAADGYRELHGRVSRDDLPRFRSTFKNYLNK
ncbi:MAG TPA: hypothetical protein VGI55_16470, partial [Solirubrobacteraceae bacterium]